MKLGNPLQVVGHSSETHSTADNVVLEEKKKLLARVTYNGSSQRKGTEDGSRLQKVLDSDRSESKYRFLMKRCSVICDRSPSGSVRSVPEKKHDKYPPRNTEIQKHRAKWLSHVFSFARCVRTSREGRSICDRAS